MKTVEQKTFEDCGLAVGETMPTHDYDTTDPAELAVITYKNLGLVADEGKARESFAQEIENLRSALPESVASQPHDILIVPRLGLLALQSTWELSIQREYSLISRYDRLTRANGNPATDIFSELWNQYTREELNQGQTADLEAQAVLLGGNNAYCEPGLYFTSQTLDEQRQSLAQAQEEHSADNDQTELRTLNIAGYIIRNAMQLERGELLMDVPTCTKFIESEAKPADGYSFVPYAYSPGGGRLDLRGSDSDDYADSRDGVRLAVGQKRD